MNRSTRCAEKSPLCKTLSVDEAARILGVSRGRAYASARDGSLPTIRLGKRFLVPKEAGDSRAAADRCQLLKRTDARPSRRAIKVTYRH